MNRLKPILRGTALAVIMSMAMCFPAFAARISFSDPSAEAGSEVTVNMKITASDSETINSSNVMLSYDAQALQFLQGTGATGDAGSIRVVGEAQSADSKELVFTLTFKALKPGSTAISVSTQEIYNKDGQIVNVGQQGSSTITVTGEAAASQSAVLSDLKISPGVLSPAFSPDIDSYTAAVDSDVDTVTVSAPAADSSASVSVSGNEGLQPGDNEIVCTVTAADGQTVKIYRIRVTRGEGEAGGEKPMVAEVPLRTYDRTITVLSAEEGIESPEGFIKCSVNIDGKAVRGWIRSDQAGSDNQADYCLFYAMNEEGEKGFYRYDRTEKTIQRYFQDPAGSGGFEEKYNNIAQEYNSLLHDYEMRFWIIIGLIGLAVILLIVIIVLVAGRGQRDDFIERREEDDREWEAEKRTKRQRLTREEQYLRGLEEEEEEAEREEDLAFIRRVQAGRAGRNPQIDSGNPGRGPAYRGNVQGGRGSQTGTGNTVVRGGQTGPVSGRLNQSGQAGPARVVRPVPQPGGNGTSGDDLARTPADRGSHQDDDFEIVDLE